MTEQEIKEYFKEFKEDTKDKFSKLEDKIDCLEDDIKSLNSKIAYAVGFSSGIGVIIGTLVSKLFH